MTGRTAEDFFGFLIDGEVIYIQLICILRAAKTWGGRTNKLNPACRSILNILIAAIVGVN